MRIPFLAPALALVLGCIVFIFHATAGHAASGSKPASFCDMKPASFATNAAMILNKVEHCAVKKCNLRSAEYKEVAGFNNSDWLWDGSDKTFTVAELNSFRMTAKSKALSVKPTGKSLINIDYSASVASSLGQSHWYIIANATYGICAKVGSSGF